MNRYKLNLNTDAGKIPYLSIEDTIERKQMRIRVFEMDTNKLERFLLKTRKIEFKSGSKITCNPTYEELKGHSLDNVIIPDEEFDPAGSEEGGGRR